VARARKVVAWIVGGTQCGLGGLASVFAYLVFASQPVQEALGIASHEAPLYMFLLLVFGFFSILSGLLVVRREDGS